MKNPQTFLNLFRRCQKVQEFGRLPCGHPVAMNESKLLERITRECRNRAACYDVAGEPAGGGAGGGTAASFRPCGTKVLKSDSLTVATCARERIAVAAMRQSNREARRRPVLLNNSAASTASAFPKGRIRDSKTASARLTASGVIGPFRNSVQTMALAAKAQKSGGRGNRVRPSGRLAISLTPALSRWEREPSIPSRPKPKDTGSVRGGNRFSLSQRERAGVRERARQIPHASELSPTGQEV
jgi:hypothetical protein